MISADKTREILREMLAVQGKELPDDGTNLADFGFRSLDFSELAMRVEDEVGGELNFDAAGLRDMTTVGDMYRFLSRRSPVRSRVRWPGSPGCWSYSSRWRCGLITAASPETAER
ncbi:acyl carrier protein [Amycolatopsis sp. NBC_01488]|uniref:acyl carrier protein n=1 Tax=Amycolatopsis sp. NBC_01488 TaxID=2903563 RepID=UPI003FA4BE1D